MNPTIPFRELAVGEHFTIGNRPGFVYKRVSDYHSKGRAEFVVAPERDIVSLNCVVAHNTRVRRTTKP